jgi:hypothetical protein
MIEIDYYQFATALLLAAAIYWTTLWAQARGEVTELEQDESSDG